MRPVALVYHAVDSVDPAADPHRLVTSPDHLASHLALLRRLGYRFATAEAALGPRPPAPRTAFVTFDDGFRDWLTEALPVLERLRVPATFYVCPGWWGLTHPSLSGGAARLLTEAEARRLVDAGMELGSHTMTHADLRALDDGALARELEDSRAAVEELTGRPCRTLAYPFGLWDARVAGAVRRAGYELAWDWLPGPWRRHAAPRLPAPPRHGAGRLALKLLGTRRHGR